MGYRLGVDLGTTWTAAGALDGADVTALGLGSHGPALPSVIAFDGDQVLIGEAAVRRLITDPASGAREMKRRLGDTTPFVLQGTPYTPEALMGRILGHVVGVAGITFGEPPEAVVLTHPATWGEFKLDLLREAGRVAGLSDVELIAEPSAAAAHYARTGKVAADGLVGVYDFGGGTFDAAVLRGVEGRFELLGKAEGLDRLGGVDLDQAVIAHVDQALDGALRELDRESPEVRQALAELREECVAAKEALSANSEVAITVAVPGLNTEVRLTRSEFESAIRPRLDESLAAFERAIAAAGVDVGALDVVLLVGGSSRIPLVAEMLAARTGRPIALDTDTKAAVSLGAVEWGAGTSADGDVDTAAAGAVAVVAAEPADAREVATADTGTAAKPARREPKTRDDVGAPKESKGRGRAARGVAGVAAAAAAVVGAGAVASAASSGGGFDPLDAGNAGGVDTDDRFAPATGESESLDAFDDVAAPPRFTRPVDPGAAGGADGATAPELAPLRQTPPPDLQPPSESGGRGGMARSAGDRDDAPERTAPVEDERVEALQDSLRTRLAAWKPPPGADPAEIAALKNELEGRIDRFDPADGMAFENAAGELQQALEDTLEDFQQSQQIDQTEQMTGRLIEEEQREAAVEAEDINNKNNFIEYQGALSDFVEDWKPGFAPWVNANDMAAFRSDLIGSDIVGRPFDPDRPLRAQQVALEEVVRNKIRVFEHQQYEEHYESESARLNVLMQTEANIINNPSSTEEQRSAAASEIDRLNTQRQTVESLHKDFQSSDSPFDPALDAALHAHLEPIPLGDMAASDFAAESVSHVGLFAEARAAVAAEATEGVDSFAATASASAVGSHVLADAFDDVAAAPAAIDMPIVPPESQMTGGGPPLAPGVRTMSADPAPPIDPSLDDALGVPVTATPMTPAAAMTSVDGPRSAAVAPDLGDMDDPLDDFGPVGTTGVPGLLDATDPMSDVSDDLPEDDSPNPLDDLDDPLDPM